MSPGDQHESDLFVLVKVSFNLFSIFIETSPGLNWFFMLLSVPRESLHIIWLGCSSIVIIASSIAIISTVYMEHVFGNFNNMFLFLSIIEIPTWSRVLGRLCKLLGILYSFLICLGSVFRIILVEFVFLKVS